MGEGDAVGTRRLAALATGAVALLVLAGCAGDSSTSQSSADPQDTLTRYFESFAASDPATREAMRAEAKVGSPADVYALHQIALARVSGHVAQGTAVISPNQVVITRETSTGTDVRDVYTDFEFDPDGRLVTWSVEGAGPLEPRIWRLNERLSVDGLTFELQTAYRTNAGDLALTYRATNLTDRQVVVAVRGYVSPEGRQDQVDSFPGFMDPLPGAYTEGYSSVPNGEPGGRLIIDLGGTQQEIVVG